MAFDIRCIKCNVKLVFDEPPAAGELIECPKCDTTFPAPALALAAAENKDVEVKKPAHIPKKVRPKERVHFSSPLLLLIVGGIMAVLFGVLSVWWWWLYKAGKAEDMLACVPDNFNVIRGVNMKAMSNYPKMKPEQEKFFDGEAQGVYVDVAKVLDITGDNSLHYFVSAKEAGKANTPTLLIFLTRRPFDPAKLGGGSVTAYPGRKQAQVICPDNRTIAVAWGGGGNEGAILNAVAANARAKPSDGMHTKVGTAGLMAIRGHIWTIIRPVGGLQNYFKSSAELIKEDGSMKALMDAFAGSSALVSWTSFGSGGVRFGAGMNCVDKDTAKDLVKDMKNGPMGKADESEPPHKIKTLFNFLTVHKEFLQYLEYRNSGECAYLISKIGDPEKARDALGAFNNQNRATGGGTGFDAMRGGGGIPGGPPAGVGVGAGGNDQDRRR